MWLRSTSEAPAAGAAGPDNEMPVRPPTTLPSSSLTRPWGLLTRSFTLRPPLSFAVAEVAAATESMAQGLLAVALAAAALALFFLNDSSPGSVMGCCRVRGRWKTGSPSLSVTLIETCTMELSRRWCWS